MPQFARVEKHLAAQPEDGRGWEVIAPVYLRLTRGADAAHAYERVISMLQQKGIGARPVASAGITGGWSAANWTQNAQETAGGNGINPAILKPCRS